MYEKGNLKKEHPGHPMITVINHGDNKKPDKKQFKKYSWKSVTKVESKSYGRPLNRFPDKIHKKHLANQTFLMMANQSIMLVDAKSFIE